MRYLGCILYLLAASIIVAGTYDFAIGLVVYLFGWPIISQLEVIIDKLDKQQLTEDERRREDAV